MYAFVAVLLVSVLLSGCATPGLMHNDKLIAATADVIGTPANEITLQSRNDVERNILYSVKTKLGQEFKCAIQRANYRAEFLPLEAPICRKPSEWSANNLGLDSPNYNNTKPSVGHVSNQNLQGAIRRTNDPRLNRQIESATPFLQDLLPKIACANSTLERLLPRYTTSDVNLFWMPTPMSFMKFHNNNSCLQIERVFEFKSLAKNAIFLTVVFVADDSGESKKLFLNLVSLPDNSWLIKDINY